MPLSTHAQPLPVRVPPFSSNGHVRHAARVEAIDEHRAVGRRMRGRIALPLAAALLLVLTLAIGYVGFGIGDSESEHRTTVPAAVAPDDRLGVLLQITIPAEALPQGDGISAGLAHFSIPPGTRSTWQSSCCAGPLIEYVVAGTYTVRADAVIQVVRASGTTEEIPAGVDVVLEAGDSLISRNETTVESARTGISSRGTAELGGGRSRRFRGGRSLPGWSSHAADVQGPISLVAAPMMVVLERVTVAPDSIYPAQTSGLRFSVLIARA